MFDFNFTMFNATEVIQFLSGFNGNACPARNIRSILFRLHLCLIGILCALYEREPKNKVECDTGNFWTSETYANNLCATKELLFGLYESPIFLNMPENSEKQPDLKHKSFWYVYYGTATIFGCTILSRVPDILWSILYESAISRFIKPMKKKEDTSSEPQSYKRIRDSTEVIFESLGTKKLKTFVLAFFIKTVSYCFVDCLIIYLIKHYFGLKNLLPSFEDFPLAALCELLQKDTVTHLLHCGVTFNANFRFVASLYSYSHLMCFFMNVLVINYYLYLVIDPSAPCTWENAPKVSSRRLKHRRLYALTSRMSAPLIDFLQDKFDDYSFNEMFVLYYISWSGLELVSFKVVICHYQFLKETNKEVKFKHV